MAERHPAAITRVSLGSAGAGAAVIRFHRTGTPEVAQPRTNNLQTQRTRGWEKVKQFQELAGVVLRFSCMGEAACSLRGKGCRISTAT